VAAPFIVVETLIIPTRVAGAAQRGRLHKQLGDAEAERLLAAFSLDHIRMGAAFRARATPQQPRHVSVYVPDGQDDALLQEACSVAGARVFLQDGKDPVEALHRATADELDRGAHVVLALCGQVPALPEHLVEEGLRAALHHDVVLGPTFDGGLWCVAFRRDEGADRAREEALLAAVFHPASFSAAQAALQVSTRVAGANGSVHWLPWWPDALEGPDLTRLKTHLAYQELRGDAHGSATAAALHKRQAPASHAQFPRFARRA
jgi:glycosyltransferase A (GT-A) superfamily protein (DUF2064 family)